MTGKTRGEFPTLANALQDLREEARLSQRALARSAGVSQGTIRDIETGKQTAPKPETIRKLANGLAKDNDGTIHERRAQIGYDLMMNVAGYGITLGPERALWYMDEDAEGLALSGVEIWEGADGVMYTDVRREQVERIMADLLGAIAAAHPDDRTLILNTLRILYDRFVVTPQKRQRLAAGERLSPYRRPTDVSPSS